MKEFAKRIAVMSKAADAVTSAFASNGDPEIISLSLGAPAPECLPVDIVREIGNDIMRYDARGIEALQYGPVMGVKDLREIISEQLLAPKGLQVDPDKIIVTTGGLETISMTCQLFIEPGDVILVENPTFFHAVETFGMFEAKCIGVEMDDDGIIMEDLEAKIKKYNPRMIYTIPTFQNPTGRTLSLERRKKLAELAEEYDVVVLEDDPYRDIRYSGSDLLPIKSFDKVGNVVLGNSFSKIFSAGSRLGYITGNDKVVHALEGVKSASNSHTSLLPQILAAEFFKRGYYPAHHENICNIYRERRDAMYECLGKYFPKGTKYTFPDGGLFTWAELPEGIDCTALREEAMTRPDVKVSYVAGEYFYAEGEPKKNCMRLSFGAIPPDRIRIAMERLGGFLCEKVDQL